MRRQDVGAARRYARALLDVAREKGDPEVVRRELAEVVELIRGHRELASALAHPALGADKRRKLVESIWSSRVSPLTLRLLALLAERGRTGLLPAIEASYAALWNAARGVVAAEAVAAVELEQAQRESLQKALAAAAGRDVELTASQDASLLGGVLVRMDGRTYDGSVRGRLRALRQRLVQGSNA